MYDRLAEKELKTATLYFNMGNYLGNNYESCVIVAQNALLDFPSSKYREEFSFLVFKAKFQMAEESVLEKREDRYRDAIDEYYAFKNEFPESTFMKDAEKMFQKATKYVND
jgi:outer membrane protein assembly factor BamD